MPPQVIKLNVGGEVFATTSFCKNQDSTGYPDFLQLLKMDCSHKQHFVPTIQAAAKQLQTILTSTDVSLPWE
ncbi:hypothetical protein WJX74_004910 [Apatococcus lobatus]|uniref:Potassium channel tetramerisation-type BTB domain-containing protein n=1 Tax=Apatococcus lobatus TaxID=904363 RepID=A0AAW1QTH8_9CHLO